MRRFAFWLLGQTMRIVGLLFKEVFAPRPDLEREWEAKREASRPKARPRPYLHYTKEQLFKLEATLRAILEDPANYITVEAWVDHAEILMELERRQTPVGTKVNESIVRSRMWSWGDNQYILFNKDKMVERNGVVFWRIGQEPK